MEKHITTLDKLTKISIIVGVLVVALSVGYYIVIFLPQKEQMEFKLQEATNLKQQALDRRLDTMEAKSASDITPATTNNVIKPSYPAQENTQEKIVDCKVDVYDVKATKEECIQVGYLEKEYKDDANDILKDQKKCFETSTSIEDCTDEAKDRLKDVEKDYGKAIDRIIK